MHSKSDNMNAVKTSIVIPLVVATIFSSCENKPEAKTNDTPAPVDSITFAAGVPLSDSANEVAYDSISFPADTSFPAIILRTGNFHQDEVKDGAPSENWYGLFKGTTHYLAATHITAKRAFDPVVDEDSLTEKTGWEIEVQNKDTCIILMARVPAELKNRQVQEILLSKNKIMPGDTITFNYQGVAYTLTATGGKKKTQDDPVYYEVWNYKLYLTANKNGQKTQELLSAQPNFDDHMIQILFAGDIDADGLPDLIIDNSPHYNVELPTLYLSKPAEVGHLLKAVGQHSAVGC